MAADDPKELLVLTDFPIGEIARQVGFEDESNFSTRFSSMTGQSPQQYRKNALKPMQNFPSLQECGSAKQI